MHKTLVANIILRILMIVCLSMLVPLGWALYDNYHSHEVIAFIVTILLGIFVSVFFRWIFRIEKNDLKRLNAKDGLAIVGLSWVFLSIFGALPLYFSGVVPSYTDAFFEITSGFTTTGATIFADIESLPRGILFWRSLTHWLGGMGIIVLYLALLPALGHNAFQLYKAEAPGLDVERVEPRIKETAKMLWSVYFLLSIAEVGLLILAGMPVFDSLCHTFGTMATGGFSTKNASIAAYGAPVQWIITVFMFLSGINFMLHYQFLRGHFKIYLKREESRYYFLLIFISIAVFAAILAKTGLSLSPLRDAAFQTISILTTTGYTTADFDLWPHMVRLALLMLMFIGACGGSTGGGMKVIRFFLTIKVSILSIVQTVFPNAILPVKFDGKPLPSRTVSSIMAYFAIFILLFFAGSILLSITEGCDLVTAFSASIASLSNIGPGLGKVGPANNYGWLSIPGKWILAFLMLAGRLELYSILILCLPSTWRK